MNKEEFKMFCHKEFTNRGFEKIKKMYYIKGNMGILCGLDLQKSNYGPNYYVNYYYFIGDFVNVREYPDIYNFDVQGRISVMSKGQTALDGSRFMTSMIAYEEYSEEELKGYFNKAFDEVIMIPVYRGKGYIMDNLGKLYFLTLRQEQVLEKLKCGE